MRASSHGEFKKRAGEVLLKSGLDDTIKAMQTAFFPSNKVAWFRNEMGYVSTLIRHVIAAGTYLLPEEEGRQARIKAGIWGNGLDGK